MRPLSIYAKQNKIHMNSRDPFSLSMCVFFAHLYSDLFAIDTVRFTAVATVLGCKNRIRFAWIHTDFVGMQQDIVAPDDCNIHFSVAPNEDSNNKKQSEMHAIRYDY